MTFSANPLPSTLSNGEYDRLVKLLTLHYAYPLPYPLAGAYFEELFANAVGARREERKLLFDVLHDNTGWSLKTHQANKHRGEKFEVVIQRCDIMKDASITLNNPVDMLGEHILLHFNGFYQNSVIAQQVADPRAAYLLRSSNERDFLFFQQRYRVYKPKEVSWRWANELRRSLMGYVGDNLVLRWYRSGTQLFGVYQIPQDAHEFHIDWVRADLDQTLDFFSRQGIARMDKDP